MGNESNLRTVGWTDPFCRVSALGAPLGRVVADASAAAVLALKGRAPLAPTRRINDRSAALFILKVTIQTRRGQRSIRYSIAVVATVFRLETDEKAKSNLLGVSLTFAVIGIIDCQWYTSKDGDRMG